MPIQECEHNYVFMGVFYWYDENSMPGSNARKRYYADKFYCSKCLEVEFMNERVVGNSYSTHIPGTFPG